MSTVLVTGGSGFVGSHVVLQLLQQGHDVRTTVRSLSREPMVRAMLEGAGADTSRLRFVVADLERDDGWADACAGCDYVMHVASPMPAQDPPDENELFRPARDGTLRVLRAARDAKVKRVVLTSSCGAVYYGHPLPHAPFDETSWTNVEAGGMSTYVKSKALAERAAWDFIAREGQGLELAVINPAGIFGPALGKDYSGSLELVKRLLDGMPRAPRLYFGVVDVRDVADLHLRAMTAPEAKGERFIAVSGGVLSMLDVANAVRAKLGERAKKVPTKLLPDWVVRVGAVFSPTLRTLLPLLGQQRVATSAKAQRVLGWQPRPPEEAVVAAAESLLRFT